VRPGDVIRQVGRRAVDRPRDVHTAVEQALGQGNDGLVVLLRRGNQTQFVSIPLVRPEQQG
jgi:S1-C subfamily serine protease